VAKSEDEIAVEDPAAPASDSPAVTSNRAVDVAVSLLLLAFAGLLGRQWRTGMGGRDRPAGRVLPVLSLGHPRRGQPLGSPRSFSSASKRAEPSSRASSFAA